jgi:hypothetical protein
MNCILFRELGCGLTKILRFYHTASLSLAPYNYYTW